MAQEIRPKIHANLIVSNDVLSGSVKALDFYCYSCNVVIRISLEILYDKSIVLALESKGWTMRFVGSQTKVACPICKDKAYSVE
jgi:hypothetical protein